MLFDPNMTLTEFAEKIGPIEVSPWQRSLLRRFQKAVESGEKFTLNMFVRRGTVAKGPHTYIGISPSFIIQDDWISAHPDTGDDRRWDSDAWSRNRE